MAIEGSVRYLPCRNKGVNPDASFSLMTPIFNGDASPYFGFSLARHRLAKSVSFGAFKEFAEYGDLEAALTVSRNLTMKTNLCSLSLARHFKEQDCLGAFNLTSATEGKRKLQATIAVQK